MMLLPLSCSPPQPSTTFDARLSVASDECRPRGRRALRQQVSSATWPPRARPAGQQCYLAAGPAPGPPPAQPQHTLTDEEGPTEVHHACMLHCKPAGDIEKTCLKQLATCPTSTLKQKHTAERHVWTGVTQTSLPQSHKAHVRRAPPQYAAAHCQPPPERCARHPPLPASTAPWHP